MSIRIYSKKAFAIGPGASRDGGELESFVTVPGSFQDMPEKFVEDPTYKLAVRYGDIIPYQAVPQVPVNAVPSVESEPEEEDEVDPVAEFYSELKGKNKAETKELAEKYGAEYREDDKLSNNKKRVLEAFKLSLTEEEENSDESAPTAQE